MWVQKVSGGGVGGLVYSPDGRTLYAADRGGAYTAWDTATRTGRCLFYLVGTFCRGLALAAAGRYLVAQNFPQVIAWDLTIGAEAARLDVTIPGDARSVPGGDRVLFHAPDRLSLRAWDPGSGSDTEFAGPFPKAVRTYDLSPDARTVAFAADYSSDAVLFDRGRRAETTWFPEPSGYVWGVRFSPDGRALAVFSGQQVRIWDIASRHRLTGPVEIHHRFGEEAFAFHPTAPVFVAVDREKHLTLFRTDSGEPIRSLDFALGRRVRCVCFSPDGLTCAVGGSNKQFAVFDVDV
jgi:WD40 repeat protein